MLRYFGLFERDWPGSNPHRDRDTFSARMIHDPKPGRLGCEGEGIYQSGTIRTGPAPAAPAEQVSAPFVRADAGYSFPVRANCGVAARIRPRQRRRARRQICAL